MEASIYQDMGDEKQLRASEGYNSLLRFDLPSRSGAEISSPTLRLYATEQLRDSCRARSAAMR